MPTDVSKLRTRMECDRVTERLTDRLAGLNNRDTNLDYRDGRSGRTEAAIVTALAEVTTDIANATATLDLTTLSERGRKQATDDLRKARHRKEDLEARDGGAAGVEPFLADLTGDELDGVIALLTAAAAAVVAHRATLPA